MTYAQGSLIQATDYYTLAAADSAGGPYSGPYVGQQWGLGTGDHGMGQSISAIQSPQNGVVAGTVITATQWTGLIQTINSCLSHQGITIVSPSSVYAGTPASYIAAIATGSALAYSNSGTTGVALTDSVPYVASYNGVWGQTGGKTLIATHTVTFASANAARYFFNAGGRVKLTFSHTGGTVTGNTGLGNAGWSALCSACGSVQIGHKNTTKVGGSGSAYLANTNNGGYWNLNTTYGPHFSQSSAAGGGYYGSELIKVECAWSGTTGANGGFPVLLVRTTFDDSAGGTFADGVTSSSLVVSAPSTTFIVNSWGNPAVSTAIIPT